LNDGPSTLSVVGLADDVLHAVVADAKKAVGGECVCDVANYLFPQGRVVSGDKNVLEEVTKLATAKGAMKCSPVAVSGAFHTSRMQSAKDALVDVLKARSPYTGSHTTALAW
jgi:[acyl-carrier-protein] S-malonyltransferase